MKIVKIERFDLLCPEPFWVIRFKPPSRETWENFITWSVDTLEKKEIRGDRIYLYSKDDVTLFLLRWSDNKNSLS